MKNMMLPAKSCSILLCALLLLAAGCKKEEQNTPETFVSDKERPTWIAVEVPDMTSSMTAVIKVDLATQYPDQAADFVLEDNDLLAAFSGETCLGIASPQDGLFYLYITAPLSVSGNGLSGEAGQSSVSEAVSLRYYSAHYKNLFEAKDAFHFVNDDHLGTVAEPLIPTFVVVK